VEAKKEQPEPRDEFTHLDEQGRAQMVDVGAKRVTAREAVARGSVLMEATTLEQIRASDVKKGDVLAVARVAGIMAAKRTSELIPLCHPLGLDSVSVEFGLAEPGDDRPRIEIQAVARTSDRTGVEMEALTAVSAAALTIYDMCKAVDRAMRISNIRLTRKSGGRSGLWERPGEAAWQPASGQELE